MNLVSIVQVLYNLFRFIMGIGISPKMLRVSLTCGFLQTSSLAQSLLMINTQVQCPVLPAGLATIWIGVWWSQKYSIDDASINLSLVFRNRGDGKVGKWCGDGLLGCGEDEVRVSCVGMASKVCMDKGMYKAGLLDDLIT